MAGFLASESARLLRGLAEILQPREAPGVRHPRELRIDDLARAAGVSVRNVRVYQERGLLPAPRRAGRTAWYSDAHLSRLQLIGRMLDRGYTFATISELLTAASYGMRVEDVLDRDNLDLPGIHADAAITCTAAELRQVFGPAAADEHIAAAVEHGLLHTHEGGYRVANARLIEAARLLIEAGVAPAELIAQGGAVRRDLTDVAHRFVGLVAGPYLDRSDALAFDENAVARISELSGKARTVVADVVQAMLVEAMENAIADALEQLAHRLASQQEEPSRAITTQGSVE
jgi:DNA-binding transcriptional MerR regulator